MLLGDGDSQLARDSVLELYVDTQLTSDYVLFSADLCRYIRRYSHFVPNPVLLLLLNFLFVLHHCFQRSMSRSGSGHGDVEGVLESGEGGGGLTLINSAISPPISMVTYRESNGDRLNFGCCASRLMTRSALSEK